MSVLDRTTQENAHTHEISSHVNSIGKIQTEDDSLLFIWSAGAFSFFVLRL